MVARQRRAVEREGRRRRRREGRERKGEEEEHRQGMSTDDELLEINRLKFENNMSKLSSLELKPFIALPQIVCISLDDHFTSLPRPGKALSGAEGVFENVVEEFSQVTHIKTRLEEWKLGFPDSYSQTHIPLYLPQLFSPFARLQLLPWNPLEVK